MSYVVRYDQASLRPNRTVRVGVADGDRLIRPPQIDDDTTPPDVVIVGDDTDVWTMTGPPPAEPPPGMEPGDAWIDVSSGDVYVLD